MQQHMAFLVALVALGILPAQIEGASKSLKSAAGIGRRQKYRKNTSAGQDYLSINTDHLCPRPHPPKEGADCKGILSQLAYRHICGYGRRCCCDVCTYTKFIKCKKSGVWGPMVVTDDRRCRYPPSECPKYSKYCFINGYIEQCKKTGWWQKGADCSAVANAVCHARDARAHKRDALDVTVCGSDGKRYGNKCLLEVEACESGKSITVEDSGRCKEYWTKCGSDWKTYGNKCEVDLESLFRSPKQQIIWKEVFFPIFSWYQIYSRWDGTYLAGSRLLYLSQPFLC